MPTFRTMAAGIGLAAFGAIGLAGVSTPAMAQSIGFYSSPLATPEPIPDYAEQAINWLASEPGNLTIPSGLTYASQPFTPRSGASQASIQFNFPPGDILVCPQTPTLTVDGTYFLGAVEQTSPAVGCYSGSGTDSAYFSFQVTLNTTSTAAGIGWLELGKFNLNGHASLPAANHNVGLWPLANYTTNPPIPPATNVDCNPASTLTQACEVIAGVTNSQFNGIVNPIYPGNTAAPFYESQNELSLRTDPPLIAGSSICIDLLSSTDPGDYFQQPCGYGDTTIADKGVIEIDEDYYLDSNLSFFQFHSRQSLTTGTVYVTGYCAGLITEGIGSVAGSCGSTLHPLTGDALYLVPWSEESLIDGKGYCPATVDRYVASNVTFTGGVGGSVTAEFDNIPLPNLTSPANPQGGVIGTPTDHSVTSQIFQYEVCDYKTGGIIGAVNNWTVKLVVDTGLDDATTEVDASVSGTAPPVVTNVTEGSDGVPGDRLLSITYNGDEKDFNLTNGLTNVYTAFLHVVDDQPNTTGVTNPGSDLCVDPPTGSTPCEPVANVVCKVTSDDGQNGYYSLFPNGIVTGTNALIPVATIWQGASIAVTTDFNLTGSLKCFGPSGVSISQIWVNPSGDIVDIK